MHIGNYMHLVMHKRKKYPIVMLMNASIFYWQKDNFARSCNDNGGTSANPIFILKHKHLIIIWKII